MQNPKPLKGKEKTWKTRNQKRRGPNQNSSPTEVPEMPVEEDVESCEGNIKFLQKEEKRRW